MITANSFEQREWWVSSGFWYPPMATRVLVTDLNLLYRETGLVRVRQAGRTVSVWWDVDNVDGESLDSVIGYLGRIEDEAPEVALNFYKVAWMEERHADPGSARRRIEELDAYRGIELFPETRIRRLDLSEISSSSPLLRRVFAAIQGPAWYDALLGGPLADYGLFFDRVGREESLTFSYVGRDSECARMLGETWRNQAIGTLADGAFADERFDRRISSSYETSMEEREPLLEHIVGLIDIGPHLIWLPYQRLLLPDRGRLACFTAITRHLADPFLSGQSS